MRLAFIPLFMSVVFFERPPAAAGPSRRPGDCLSVRAVTMVSELFYSRWGLDPSAPWSRHHSSRPCRLSLFPVPRRAGGAVGRFSTVLPCPVHRSAGSVRWSGPPVRRYSSLVCRSSGLVLWSTVVRRGPLQSLRFSAGGTGSPARQWGASAGPVGNQFTESPGCLCRRPGSARRLTEYLLCVNGGREKEKRFAGDRKVDLARPSKGYCNTNSFI